MEYYRGQEPQTEDTLTYWRGKDAVWEINIPPNAEFSVNGNRILAVTTTKDGVFTKELKIP